MIDWKALRSHAVTALAGVSGGVLLAVLVALWAPWRAFLGFSGITAPSPLEHVVVPGQAHELPPAPAASTAPEAGRHRWRTKPRPPAAPPVPVLEAAKAADVDRLNRKLEAAEVQIGKTHDLLASGKLPDGKELFAVAPKDGGPASIAVYQPRIHFGGEVGLDGRALFDFKGKLITAEGGLLADLVRVGRFRLAAGPGGLYDQSKGLRAGVLVHANLCLMHCT